MAKAHVSKQKKLFVRKVAGRAMAEGRNSNILTQYLNGLAWHRAEIKKKIWWPRLWAKWLIPTVGKAEIGNFMHKKVKIISLPELFCKVIYVSKTVNFLIFNTKINAHTCTIPRGYEICHTNFPFT